ncbi:MAG TPA: hypothetical protein VE974_10735 [Thermoanaerobaculia bacterium]|nr:hypothetical protein [Thermoanaerobaculia bacterium]
MKRTLLAVPALLALFALPASAGVVTAGSVTVTQYSYPYFTALVQATGTMPLVDAHLVVNGTTVVRADKVELVKLDPRGTYVLWKIYKYAAGVVKPGDTVTAVVSDLDGDSDDRTVPCGAGSTKKKSQETAACR